ncbi:uncharacterized protein LOC125209641 [Salvia hispanica]|uniref:uncharacterized protein LOC125209641 n=1 Tax=Salvia hispanica TaxID=49212 RepID=UPI002009D05F|nr:uncharacterized protein LOC125209641 [Salvia hispanica]
MGSLQKLKFLATQCGVAGSPTRSPVIHLRRPRHCDRNDEERPVRVSRHKLKDLFVSSPPSFSERASENVGERLMPAAGGRRGGARSLSTAFRQRLLLRRAWRPVLVAIPE